MHRLARFGELQARHAGRVVATVLEPLEAFHQDRGGLAIAEIADDSAHFFTRTPGSWISLREASTGAGLNGRVGDEVTRRDLVPAPLPREDRSAIRRDLPTRWGGQ